MKKKDLTWVTVDKRSFLLVNYFLFAFSLLVVIGFSPVLSWASQVTLAWDESNDPGIKGYKVYAREEGQAYNYDNFSWDGSSNTCTIDGLDDLKGYYFVVRAYNDTAESANSNEVFYRPTSDAVNQPPVAEAGPDQTVEESAAVMLSGSNSYDPDDGIASFYWEQTGGPGVQLLNYKEEEASFIALQTSADGVTLSFRLTVADYSGLKSVDECFVNVSSLNVPPTAEAGPDIVADEGESVTLDATRSYDPDDGIGSYHWFQISGTPVTLFDSNTNKAIFTTPDINTQGETLKFQLTVSDKGGLESSDTCFVTVSWVNEPPTAHAGDDQTVSEGDSVTLNGSRSMDNDGGIAGCQWSQTGGPPVSLSDATAYQPEFIAPDAGAEDTSLAFKLTVTDKGGLQAQDSCIVKVTPLSKADDSDSVQIIKARYRISRKKLRVQATSDAPSGSVILTAWADDGTRWVKLGDLRYRRGRYSKTFRKMRFKPENVIVKSSGGGSDTQPCTYR